MTNRYDSVVKESLTTAGGSKQYRAQRLKNIYESGKLEQPATTEDSSVVRQGCLPAHGVQAGGLLKARELFGKELEPLISELNGYLIA